MKTIGLSASTLSDYVKCPQCFWYAKKAKVEKPRGIFPNILKALDKAMKESVARQVGAEVSHGYLADAALESGLMPYPDRAFVEKCMSWRTFQAKVSHKGREILLWGELDELLTDASGVCSPYDYKSQGAQPADGYTEKYYQLQADIYDVVLRNNKIVMSGFAYFTYAWPLSISAEGTIMNVGFQTIRIATDPTHALDVAFNALECLDLEAPPASSPSCELCEYIVNKSSHGV